MATDNIKETPMMKQFRDIKAQYPGAMLLFRCGDFYETYCDDAVIAAEILGITLTRRSNGGASQSQTAAMAGFPHHALDTYLPKLIRAGRRVAICDQLEDPKLTKTLVKRGITELVTPGVTISDNVLNHKENNFLAAVHFGKAACGVAFLDISTGEFLTAEGTYDYVDKLLANFSPKEVLYDKSKRSQFERIFGNKYCVYELDDWYFTEQASREKLLKHFGIKNLKGFGVEHLTNGIIASGVVLQYLEITQHTHISHINVLSRIEEDRFVRLDRFTVRNLELVQPMNGDGSSLLDIIDKTVAEFNAAEVGPMYYRITGVISDVADAAKGRFYIKGRKNNMILGPSGENIYPEEIEDVINNAEGVTESIVVERNGHLVALVQPIEGFIDWDKEGEDKMYEKIDTWKEKILTKVNKNVNKTSRISSVEVMKEPFEKTATMKIRRFKYKDSAPTVEADRKSKENENK